MGRQLEKRKKKERGGKEEKKGRKREKVEKGKEKRKNIAPNMLLHFYGSRHFCERD
jgi:hypothetical protein